MINRVVVLALGADVAVVVAHVLNALPVPPLERPSALLDLAGEANLPTWWASAQLLVAAVLLAAAAERRRDLGVWLAAGLVALLSLDETAGIHERFAYATSNDLLPVTGIWPFVFAPLAVAGALLVAVTAPGTWSADHRGAALLALGFALMIAFAAGVELAVNFVEWDGPAHFVQVLVEEAGELLAGTILLAGAYRFARHPVPTASEPEGDA